MINKNFDILFAIMAVQEVIFFSPIAKRLMEEESLNIAFMTFHEAGDDILEREGIPYFSLHKLKRGLRKNKTGAKEIKELQKRFGINFEELILHEKLTANRSKDFLSSKVVTYCNIFDNAFSENNIGCVVQELGGFIAPQILYYVSRYHKVNHIFIEPAMFRKRVVFTLNNLYAEIPDYGKNYIQMDKELEKLLDEYMTQKTVVIPKKDKHFFKDMTLGRLLSPDNFGRLSRKLYHKYILGREEEYNRILWYIAVHVMKMLRRKVLSFYYSMPVEREKYVYYPLHVPLDVQLTVRCPEFLEQESVVEHIARVLPTGYKLYIKEHPAAIGGHSLSKLGKVIKYNKDVRLIHPKFNSFDIIKNADCIITINSKVGFEALIQRKPVIVLGKTFYKEKGLTIDIDSLKEVPTAITKALNVDINVNINNNKLRDYFFNKAFHWSYKGELYENSPENLHNFYDSFKAFLLKSGIIQNRELSLKSTLK